MFVLHVPKVLILKAHLPSLLVTKIYFNAHPVSTCSKEIDFNSHFLSTYSEGHDLNALFFSKLIGFYIVQRKQFQRTCSFYISHRGWFWKHIFCTIYFSKEVISTHIFFLHFSKGNYIQRTSSFYDFQGFQCSKHIVFNMFQRKWFHRTSSF